MSNVKGHLPSPLRGFARRDMSAEGIMAHAGPNVGKKAGKGKKKRWSGDRLLDVATRNAVAWAAKPGWRFSKATNREEPPPVLAPKPVAPEKVKAAPKPEPEPEAKPKAKAGKKETFYDRLERLYGIK